MGNDVRRRTPMGRADAKASNHVLVGLGVGIITAVSGLSVAGTMTAINAMNRQSDEALEAARIQAANNAAQAQNQNGNNYGNQNGNGGSPQQEPTVTPAPEKWTSDQIGWMQDNQVVYDEYGLPEDQSGNLLDDPTTHVYDPARRAYFFNDDGTPKTPYIDDLPTTADYNESENPIVLPHIEPEDDPNKEKPEDKNPDGGDVVNPDGSVTHPDGTVTRPDGTIIRPDGTVVNPDGTVTNPDGTNPDETNPDGTNPDETNPDETNPDGPETQPDDTNPDGTKPDEGGTTPGRGQRTRPEDEWWYADNGNLLPGIQLDGSGRPYYVVKSGDALSRLGRRFGYNWHELAKVSGLVDDQGNYKGLHPGDIIRFPDHAPSTTPTTTDPGSKAPGRG